jgi:tRNA A-37 threonylcarbamoyl transferase component Bud32
MDIMRIVHVCKATYVHHTYKCDEVVFGSGAHQLILDAKKSLSRFDRLRSRITSIQWIRLKIHDTSDHKHKYIYVKANQLSIFMHSDPTQLKKEELQFQFYAARHFQKQKWVQSTPKVVALIDELQLGLETEEDIISLCQFIEQHKHLWNRSFKNSERIAKGPLHKFSIYLLKPEGSTKMKILINLGKSYKYKTPHLYRAVDYTSMKIRSLLIDRENNTCVILDKKQVLECERATAKSELCTLKTNLKKAHIKVTIAQLKSISKKIDRNRSRWLAAIGSETIGKIPKSESQKYSIYLIRQHNGNKVKIIINLGTRHLIGEGSFKVVTKAIDYDTKKIGAFAKIKMAGNTKYESLDYTDLCTQNELATMYELHKRKGVISSEYAGTVDSHTYFFMKYCELGDLQSCIDQLKTEDLPQIMEDLLDGLQAIHQIGRVHQDLKTDNILLYRHTHITRAKISDYSFCFKEVDASTNSGNLRYAPPYKLRNQNFPRKADTWALGMIFYSLLYGEEIYNRIADRCWATHKDREHLAIAFEKKYIHDLPYATDKLNQLIFGMIAPNPAQSLSLTQAKAAFNKLRKSDFDEYPQLQLN